MTRPPRFPGYDVLAKWDSPSFDDVTRGVLAHRLDAVPPRRWLTADEWALLDAVNARLLPQPERENPIPLTPWIDAMLIEDRGEGYRLPDTPPLRDAWRQGLAAVDDEARRLHDLPFAKLDAAAQDAVLQVLADGRAASPRWQGLDAQHFFIDCLLKTAAGFYYAHPAAWNEIGFGGPANPRGYVRLGFDSRDPWEAKEAP
jgi:hypothetical protein